MRVGRLHKPHGVRGELKLEPAEGSSGAWRKARRARAGDGGWRGLQNVRGGGRFFLVKLEGIDTPEQARPLSGLDFFVPRSELESPGDGSCYLADLIGLEVADRCGQVLGVIEDSFFNGAHEVYVVRRGRRRWLLPAVDDMVLETDLAAGRMLVDVPEGLIEL